MNNYVHVYTGNGKGKTTSALGLTLRASGNGMKIFFGQFMKGEEYSEIKSLRKLPGIEIVQLGIKKCILKKEVDQAYIDKTKKGLEFCRQKVLNGNYDLVVLDEIIVSVWFGLLDEADVINFINEFSGQFELVLTGRYATQAIIDKADLVTEMKCIKHYYDKGVMSRKGIEN
jgi:cob(I)alamin adenosyltransferase